MRAGRWIAPTDCPRRLTHLHRLAVRKFPQMGDISIRSALTVHRGTANHSAKSRPVLGLDAVLAENVIRAGQVT